MIAMDDFLTFKKLMVRRNMELELEAVKALQSASVPIHAPASSEDAERDFEMAVKASEEISAGEKAKMMREIEKAEAKDSEGEVRDNAVEVDKQLKEAMDANLMEMELFHKQEEFEALQLEQAIAASLALHEEELREKRMEAKNEEEEDRKVPPAAVVTEASSSSAEEEEEEEEEEEGEEAEAEAEAEAGDGGEEKEAEVMLEQVAEAKVTQDVVITAKVSSPVGGPTNDSRKKMSQNIPKNEDEVIVVPRDEETEEEEEEEAKGGDDQQVADDDLGGGEEEEEEEEEEEKTESNVADVPVVHAVKTMTIENNDGEVLVEKVKKKKKDKKDKRDKKDKKKKKKEKLNLLGPVGTLGSLNSRPVLGGIAPNKGLDEMASQMATRKKMAQEAFRKNHEMLQEQKQKEEEMRETAKITEEDMRKRTELLKRQRDMIIAKKKADREKAAKEALKGEEEEKEKVREFKLFELKKKSSAPVETAEDTKEDENDGGMNADERRSAMRIALAARMKRDLLVAEEERLTKMQDDQFAELDAKLRRVEELRDENRMREEDLKEAILQNQKLRAINIHRSQINTNLDSFEEFG